MQQLRKALLAQGVQLHVVTSDYIAVLDPSELSNKAKRQLLGILVSTSNHLFTLLKYSLLLCDPFISYPSQKCLGRQLNDFHDCLAGCHILGMGLVPKIWHVNTVGFTDVRRSGN